MRKFFTLFALVLSVFMIGCENQPVDNPPAPEPPIDETDEPKKPEVELREVSVTAETFTFELTSTVAGEYAFYYCGVQDSASRPDIGEWFELNSGTVDGKVEVTIEGLTPSFEYTLFAVVRAKGSGFLSDVKKLDFTTNSSGVSGPITLLNVAHDRIAFRVNLEGYYRYSMQPEATLSGFGQTIENWVVVAGYIGIGVDEYEFVNGERDEIGDVIKVVPDSPHYIAVVPCDDVGNATGEVSVLQFNTPKAPVTEAGVNITLSDITGTSVNIKCEPDSSIARYHVLVQPKSQVEFIINEPSYGVNTLISLMATNYAWAKETAYEGVWNGLTPSTEYCVCVLAIDGSGAQNFTYDRTFTTTAGSGAGVVFDVSLSQSAAAPHSSIDINITAGNITSMRYVFNDSAMVKMLGLTDDNFVQFFQTYGENITADQLSKAHNGTLTITKPDLWPEAEYTVVLYAVSDEQIKGYKTAKLTTAAQPVPKRVESSLFESLQGEWNMSYRLDYLGTEQVVSNHVVTISQGVDDKSATDYRNQNRLVITDWAFQTKETIPTMTPQDLMDSHSMWRDNPSLAYRDYGPKTFLEIAEGDVITMPTSLATRFYAWADVDNPIFYFFGYDSRYSSAAPCTFPVELSDDGNTLTIKPFVDTYGAYMAGAVYYPAVARDTVYSTALTEIVLTRVK